MRSRGRGRPHARLSFTLPILALGVAVAPSAPADTLSGCQPPWVIVDAPVAKNVNGFGVVSGSDIWAVGARYGQPEQAFIEHWNGSKWSAVQSSGGVRGDHVLNKVAVVSRDDAWAVGYRAPSGGTEKGEWYPLIEHWDGAGWTVAAAAPLGVGGGSLTDVTAVGAHDVWAAGYRRVGETRLTLLEHWDGTSWSRVPSPDPSPADDGLVSVSAVASDDVWAVGYRVTAGSYQPLIEHWNGIAWKVVPVASVGGGDAVLTAITTSPGVSDDAWAVGYRSGGAPRSLIMRWDGQAWSVVTPGGSSRDIDVLLDAARIGRSDVWAVGFSYDVGHRRFLTLTEHWNGSGWAFVASQDKPAGYNAFVGVGGVPGTGQVWAGGRATHGLMETACGPTTAAAGNGSRSSIATIDPEGSASTMPVAGPMGPSQDRDHPRAPGSIAADLTATAVTATDTAVSAGIAEATRTRGAVVLDFDGDGRADIFLGRHQQAARLYHNVGSGRFSEVDRGTFPRRDRHGCTSADVNMDGRPDIFCTTGASEGTKFKRDELWIQQADHSFVDRSAAYGVLNLFGRGRDSTFVDVNDDGLPDLFVGTEPDRPDGLPAPTRLYTNMAGTRFQGDTSSGLVAMDQESCAATFDYNADGRQDLLVCTTVGLKLYRNDRTAMTDVTKAVGLGATPTEATMTDLNGDGRLDIAQVQRDRLTVSLQASGSFRLGFTAPLQGGLGIATGDVNGDTRPDLYVLQRGGRNENLPDQVWVNDGSGAGFSQMQIPSTSLGDAEDVEPIDADGNGLTDFLVLNGNGRSDGPVQLITFSRAPSGP